MKNCFGGGFLSVANEKIPETDEFTVSGIFSDFIWKLTERTSFLFHNSRIR